MNKALIFPIISLVVLFTQKIFNISWTDQELQIINDGILSFVILLGFFMHPTKKR